MVQDRLDRSFLKKRKKGVESVREGGGSGIETMCGAFHTVCVSVVKQFAFGNKKNIRRHHPLCMHAQREPDLSSPSVADLLFFFLALKTNAADTVFVENEFL